MSAHLSVLRFIFDLSLNRISLLKFMARNFLISTLETYTNRKKKLSRLVGRTRSNIIHRLIMTIPLNYNRKT